MLLNNKKALSEVVGYTILIVIAISLSVLVYAFLRNYIPKEAPTCEEDLNLIVQNYACKGNMLNLTLLNKGLFKADAVYLRFGNSSQKIKDQINKDNFLLYGSDNRPGLNPQESSSSTYVIPPANSLTNYELELEPAVIINKKIVVCEKSIITQPIRCV